jgi:phospho-N-acetylmuramoyl-pentapeptide-transferase
MLYLLLAPLGREHIIFNVFRYLTFRSAMAFISALVLSLVMGPWLIQRLRELQRGGETLREDTPARHRTKAGTPSMGGILILGALLVSTLLWANLKNRYVWLIMLGTAGFGGIGLWDDLTKLRTRKGIPARFKFAAQVLLVLVVLEYLYSFPADGFTTLLAIPFLKGWLVRLGWLWIVFALLVIVGTSNAVNLTDGLDGLATVPVITAGFAFGVIAYLTGNFRAADYLKILNVKGAGELSVFCAALVGAGLGFLWYNAPPAMVFMGDTGSLSIGGAIGVISVITKHELVLAIIGGLFVLETVSVIVQVASFKLTGKRVFRMAPLHHHFEKKGWQEPTIVIRFWIIASILAIAGLSTLKLR